MIFGLGDKPSINLFEHKIVISDETLLALIIFH